VEVVRHSHYSGKYEFAESWAGGLDSKAVCFRGLSDCHPAVLIMADYVEYPSDGSICIIESGRNYWEY
jgi:hypothetical protein